MASTFSWAQTNGPAGSEVTTDLGETGNLFNFKNADDAIASNYTDYPITAGNNSYEVWLRGHWTGTFNKIENVRFWMSTDFSPNTGLSVMWGTTTTYSTPTNATSTIATNPVPTADPGAANVGIGGDLNGALTAPGYSDYIVLQLQTTTDAAPGDTSLAEFTIEWDEQ